MNEEDLKVTTEKLLSWIESFGYKVLTNDDIKVIVEGPDGAKQKISKTNLYFLNGYLFGALVKGMSGQI